MNPQDPTLMDLIEQAESVSDFEMEENREAVRDLPPQEVMDILKRMYMKGSQIKRKHNLGRNDPCHCGSGKKYKKCHMRDEQVYEEVYHYGFRPAPPIENHPPKEEVGPLIDQPQITYGGDSEAEPLSAVENNGE